MVILDRTSKCKVMFYYIFVLFAYYALYIYLLRFEFSSLNYTVYTIHYVKNLKFTEIILFFTKYENEKCENIYKEYSF